MFVLAVVRDRGTMRYPLRGERVNDRHHVWFSGGERQGYYEVPFEGREG
jgi:hypothetical protein